jgi:hypothetical protein
MCIILIGIQGITADNSGLPEALPQSEEVTPGLDITDPWALTDQSGGYQSLYTTARWAGYIPISCPPMNKKVADVAGDYLKVSASVIYQNVSDPIFESADSYRGWSLSRDTGSIPFSRYPGGTIVQRTEPLDSSSQTTIHTSIRGWVDQHTEFRVNTEGSVKKWILDEENCTPSYVERKQKMEILVPEEAIRVSDLVYHRLTGTGDKNQTGTGPVAMTPEPSPTPVPTLDPTPVPSPDAPPASVIIEDPGVVLDEYREYQDHARELRTLLNDEYQEIASEIEDTSVSRLHAEASDLDARIISGKNEFSKLTVLEEEIGDANISAPWGILTSDSYHDLKIAEEELIEYYTLKRDTIQDKLDRYESQQERYHLVEEYLGVIDVFLMQIGSEIKRLEKMGADSSQ